MAKEQHTKRANFPMGIIREVTMNDQGEVTEVLLKKGDTNEFVRRHVESIIPLLSKHEYKTNIIETPCANSVSPSEPNPKRRNLRRAAKEAAGRMRHLVSKNLV